MGGGLLAIWLMVEPAAGPPPTPAAPAPAATPPKPRLSPRPTVPPPGVLGPTPEPAEASPSELGLARQADGSYLYTDPGLRFTARFLTDGTVAFADRFRKPSLANRQHGRCCGKVPGGLPGLNPLVGMPMTGPIEWILLAQGKDLAAKGKADLLERTRELRTAMAIAFGLRLIEQRLRELEPELAALWNDESIPIARRRRLLFELWDDCDERVTVAPAGEIPEGATIRLDEARLDAAERARRRIEAFVRRHAPRGSARGYSAAELRELNARRTSREPFSPYERR